jgi:hypothetical protein
MATYVLHLQKRCTKQSLKASKVTTFETVVNILDVCGVQKSSFWGGYCICEYKKVSWHEVRQTRLYHMVLVKLSLTWQCEVRCYTKGTNCPTLEILAFSSKPALVTVPACVHRIYCSVLLLQA